ALSCRNGLRERVIGSRPRMLVFVIPTAETADCSFSPIPRRWWLSTLVDTGMRLKNARWERYLRFPTTTHPLMNTPDRSQADGFAVVG
ncbi:MAG: hypothetical protein KF861_20215, partial [Planctomycetaceae bacterium]|nr:hypothetical protein [Planctomycetaceae bacterium]